MKNLIYICIFNHTNYIDLLYLLLESIYISSDNIDILIYTNTEFMNIISNSNLYSDKIIFEINDNKFQIYESHIAKLDVFNFSIINNYNKILYLDTDILVIKDINNIFNLIDEKSNLLYIIDGVLLFNNCNIIKVLFNIIKENSYEESHILYYSKKYDLIDNKLLNDNKTLIHIKGDTYINKLINMKKVFNELKEERINIIINQTKEYIDKYLLPIILEVGEQLEGNIFMHHLTTDYTNAFENKVKNIVSLLMNNNINNVLEIGFNSGFSTLLMLMSNGKVNLTCNDLGEHKYTIPCYNKLKETFGDRINIIIGDSTKVLPEITGKYDLIHIDGGHMDYVATNDIINSYNLSKSGTILIMDDYDFFNLHILWNKYTNRYGLRNPDSQLYLTNYHSIKYVIK